MSDGKTHAQATTALIFPVAMASLLLYPSDPFTAMAAGAIGCATGLIIDPDLDLDDITRSEWQMIKKLWIFGMLWVTLWYPYAWLIPHRSPLSHWPIIGTAGRVGYLLGWLWLLGAIAGVSVPVLAIVSQPLFMIWFGGLAVADMAHFIMDVVSSKIKRIRKLI
jgi:uncharacterized metal-binding protein